MSERLRVAILAVGTELLLGDQLDTNSQWLSQRLREIGIEPRYHVSAGDDLDELAAGLRWLVDGHDVVIVGGGLGPTSDDLTREAVAATAGVELRSRADLEEAIIQRFATLGARMPARNLQQARIPVGATALPPLGTAPGFRLDVERSAGGFCTVWAVPGVPWELQDMFIRDVQPELLDRTGHAATVTRVVHVAGMGESAVAEVVAPVEDRHVDDGITISYLARRTGIQVRVTARGADPDEARATSEPVVDELRAVLGPGVTGIDDEGIEAAVVHALRNAGATVGLAESCTAGGVAARLAGVPGASRVLRGGLVVYMTDTKVALLGIDPSLLDANPPVSEPVTRAMAVAARERTGADYGLAVTCVAGPDPQDGVEVGRVVWAVADADAAQVWSRSYPGSRSDIQDRVGTAVLEALRRRLAERGS